MWCRRYDGHVRAVILVKYLCRNPHISRASILLLFRPVQRPDGKWAALQVQVGPKYILFPRPADAGTETDGVPLVYEDYFGPENLGVGKTGQERFDPPLELVRELVEESIAVTCEREGYRFVSDGSSVASQQPIADGVLLGEEKMQDEPLVVPPGFAPVEGEFEEFEDD
ncbi:hypothetical protein Q9L58_010360 [Maublancomyces gigas]|uniref:Uncharacterized protein n=1 Tax=Discina gigas TaxID=1032678 RepID=A0ABR3G4B7_9PEZI